MRHVRNLLLSACLVVSAGAHAEPLPKYLTIDFVLSQVDDEHPAVRLWKGHLAWCIPA